MRIKFLILKRVTTATKEVRIYGKTPIKSRRRRRVNRKATMLTIKCRRWKKMVPKKCILRLLRPIARCCGRGIFPLYKSTSGTRGWL
jgi:hypothetical protein